MYGRDLRRNHVGTYNNYRQYNGNNSHRTGQTRNRVIPNEPPYTAYIGNAPDTMVQGDFEHQLFVGLKVKQVRLVRDRQTDRFRGFAYVDFEDADSLRNAIALDGTCVNDRPIRIDVASRTLNTGKSEGFRHKPGFEMRDDFRQSSSMNNYRSSRGLRQDGHQYGESQMMNSSYHENGYTDEYLKKRNSNEQAVSHKNNEQQYQGSTEQTPPLSTRQISDEVFLILDTPVSNNDDNLQQLNDQEDKSTMIRQKRRNWADCPIDESVVDTSPLPLSNTNNVSIQNNEEDCQSSRNRIPKSHSNQHVSSRLMSNSSGHGHYSHGGSSSGPNRNFFDQISPFYSNQTHSYYYKNSPMSTNSYYTNFTNLNNRSQVPSSGSRSRFNSNRNSRTDNSNHNGKRLISTTSTSSYEISTTSSENRPRLKLLPRSQKLSSSTDDQQSLELSTRNLTIFGSGKPRDERDPKLMELNKHIEEIVEKEQHTSESTMDLTKPVQILKFRSDSSNTN